MRKSKHQFERLLNLESGEYYDLEYSKLDKKTEMNIRNGANNYARSKGFTAGVSIIERTETKVLIRIIKR